MLPSAGVNGPKLILQASLAGLYGAVVAALALLAVNPDGGGGPVRGLSLVPVVLVYTLAAGLLWPLLYGAVRFFARRALHLRWLSLRYIMAFHAINTLVIVAACWSILREQRKELGPGVARHLATICAAVTLAWLYGVVITLVPRISQTLWLQSSAAGLAMAGLLAPIWSEPPGTPSPSFGQSSSRVRPLAGRLVLLNFDGADLEDILTLEAQGKLPAFARLRDEGAYGRLRSVRPCQTAVTRTTLVTGKLPFRHGVRSALSRRVMGRGPELRVVPPGIAFDVLMAPLLETRVLGVADRDSLALWEIAVRMGGVGEAAGWDMDADGPVEPRLEGISGDHARLADLLDVGAVLVADPGAAEVLAELGHWIEEDERVIATFERVLDDGRPGVVALSFPGLDRVAHGFLRYARPGAFGNVNEREIELYGRVLEGYYRRVDGIVARAMQAPHPGTTLFVTSSHGMTPALLRRRLAAMVLGREPQSGTHESAPGGFLFARGPSVQPEHKFGRGSIADVVPTALYALGLPVSRDLDGTILTGVFEHRYTFEHPTAVIETYEPSP